MVISDTIAPSLAQPAGRVARKRQAIRARLLAAGFAQAGQKGLNGIVISDLTDAADCAKGAFYLHFESREAFIAELIDQALEPVGRALDAYGKTQPADVALTTGLRYSLMLAIENPLWGHFVAAVTQSADPLSQGFGRRIAADILRGREQGLFAFNDLGAAVAVAGGVFLAGVIGVASGSLVGSSPSEATRHALLALGVPASRAAALAVAPLPNLNFESHLVAPLRVTSEVK
ncbi:MAG: TetR/AcrR family transcriptional regulator [Alphaproteobacteria bacterium]|nr:TetR/AcrR family transcriptional regulator [Alphaproteobacteria bacterium]